MGRRTGGYPTHYKLDLANPEKRICIEVDGPSHGTFLARERDARKTSLLEESGWSVYRVSNERALALFSTCTSADILRTLRAGV